MKFWNFLNDISFLEANYAMLAFLLNCLNSSSDTIESTSSRPPSVCIFKADGLNEHKASLWCLPLQLSFNEINFLHYNHQSRFLNILILFISPSNLTHAINFKINYFSLLPFSFSSHDNNVQQSYLTLQPVHSVLPLTVLLTNSRATN